MGRMISQIFTYAAAGLGVLILLLAIIIVAGGGFVFAGPDYSRYDTGSTELASADGARGGDESPEHAALVETILAEQSKPGPTGKELIDSMRQKLDERGAAFRPAFAAEFISANAEAFAAEWVTTANTDPRRRMLYLHGGAYVMGSAKSHRPITSRLSQISGAAVLAVDYRLMPEHKRSDGIEDCRRAYEWLLANGPRGASPANTLIVAGDSSGGNLALATIAWARDAGLRPAEAVVVMSPQTDATLSSPSLRKNTATDVMQGKSFGPIVNAPSFIGRWFSYFFTTGGINPSAPVVSPLLGDLSNLPPTLIQVSRVEMFLDDAVRYANKAQSQGSPVVLQTWPFALHVWQAFDVPEANEAYAEIAGFLGRYAVD